MRYGAGGGWPRPLLLVLAGLAGLAFLRVARGIEEEWPRSRGLLQVVAVSAALMMGVWSGSAERRRSARACPGDLESGALVVASGRPRETTESGRREKGRRTPSRVRLTLRDVSLTAAAGRCRLPELRVYAAAGPAVRAEATIRVRGEWMRSAHRSSTWPARPSRTGSVSALRIEVVDATAGGASGGRLRDVAARRIRERVAPDVGPLAAALTLADTDGLDPGVRRRFAEAGLAHLLAISGLHVGILAAGLLWGLARVVPRRAAYPAAAGAVGLYVLFIGAPPSAVRAALMFAGWAWTRVRGRPVRVAELAAVAALVAVAADPLVLLEPGFQLSFAGLAGVMTGVAASRRLRSAGRGDRGGGRRRPARRLRWLLDGLLAGSGAFLATAPFTAAHFQQVAPVAVVSHLVGTPLTLLAVASVTATVVLPGAGGGVAGAAATTILRWLQHTVDAFAAVPLGHGNVTPPTALQWVACALFTVGVVRFLRGAPGQGWLPWAAGAVALLVAAPSVARLPRHGRSLLCSLNVGQGDAAALRTRGGHWIVFDAGPAGRNRDAGRRVVVPYLRREGARSVEVFALSHPDQDHVGGAAALFDAYRVGRVLDSGDPVVKAGFARYLDRVREEGAEWLAGRAGDRLTIDNVTVTVLGPPDRAPGRELRRGAGRRRSAGANATSLVLRVTVSGRFVYLNTGDAPISEERELLRLWPADSLRADLLKVGHHGSRSSSAPEWLRAVRPQLAVISAGAGNAYGHPHPAVLRRLRAAGVRRVWRTDRMGTLCVEIDDDGRWRRRGESVWQMAGGGGGDLTSEKRGE